MTDLRKRSQDKLRRKYEWHSARRVSSNYSCLLYKFVKGGWVRNHPELGRATIAANFELGSVLGDVRIMLSEEFCETDNKEYDRSIGFVLSFEELESVYLIAKEIHENREKLKSIAK